MGEVITDQKTAMRSIYECVAGLLDYPGADWRSLIESCGELVSGETAEIANAFTAFRDEVLTLSIPDLQELYTRTFDLNPVCALEIGYHLFGENYKRGLFLANLLETETPFKLGQEHQLPDYLPVLLRLLTKLDDEELRTALMAECMLPAIEKMIAALRNGENPYRHLIATVRTLLRAGVGAYSATVQRAHLPVLTNDRRSHPNHHEFAQPELSVASCELVDRGARDRETNPDLF